MKVHSRDVYDIAYTLEESGKLNIISAGGDNCVKLSSIENIFEIESKIQINRNISNDDFEVNSVVLYKEKDNYKMIWAGDDCILK